MAQKSLRAVFMRGGTSKGLMLHQGDLPASRDEWTSILCSAMGSPDMCGRQLDGMGGGLSSLSKVCVIGPPTRADADVDYTCAQVLIKEARLDFRSNWGNMSSAVGPFAFDEGLVEAAIRRCHVRIHNTNTAKIIHSTFGVEGASSLYQGDLTIPGVAGAGAPIRLDFLDPGGATTGSLLPSGSVAEWIEVTGRRSLEVSLVDAANAAVFVRAADVGLRGTELPDELDSKRHAPALLEVVRRAASVRMGIAPDTEAAARITSVPFVAVVSATADSITLDGHLVAADEAHLVVRVISNAQPHRALPLTISLCTAVASRLDGSVVAQTLAAPVTGVIRLATPSGVLNVDADVAELRGE